MGWSGTSHWGSTCSKNNFSCIGLELVTFFTLLESSTTAPRNSLFYYKSSKFCDMATNIAQRDAIAHRARAMPTNLEPYVTIDKIWILFNSHLNNIDSYVYSYIVFLVNDCCRFTLTSPVVSKTKSEFSCRNMLPLSFSPIITVPAT